MANAIRDENRVTSWLGVLNTDGTTLVPIKLDASTNALTVNEVDTISFTPSPIDKRDDNRIAAVLAEGDDGLTYPLVVNADGEVLIDNL